jgi:tryptophanyl-tRNA synthetase
MIVTGLQPTGSIHIGNYLGAILPLVALQRPGVGSAVFIADYHAITMGHDPVELRQSSLKLAAMIIAAGFDDQKQYLFKQSAVRAHTELGWILQCTGARMGWLNRMTQFREKSGQLSNLDIIDRLIAIAEADDSVYALMRDLQASNVEGPSVGLFTYPVLQAADILLYQADEVPVGEDQSQHLNLAVDIAEKFNRQFGPIFTIPKAIINPAVKRIMSLTDPTKKMSKSEPNADSRINLDDTAEDIARKVKRATSDSAMIPGDVSGLLDRPGLTNLLTIYGAFTGRTMGDALLEFEGKGFGVLKPAVTEAVIEGLRPVQQRYREIMDDRAGLEVSLGRSADNAARIADETLHAVRGAIGVE